MRPPLPATDWSLAESPHLPLLVVNVANVTSGAYKDSPETGSTYSAAMGPSH